MFCVRFYLGLMNYHLLMSPFGLWLQSLESVVTSFRDNGVILELFCVSIVMVVFVPSILLVNYL